MICGVLGGGQLARMLALAGHPLGIGLVVLDPSPEACAGPVARLLASPYDDPAALDDLAALADCISFEFENVPPLALEHLKGRLPIYPPPEALAVARDRLREKRLFERLGIPTAAYVPLSRPEELDAALERTGRPALLKTRTLGYDGKGQWPIRDDRELERARAALDGRHCLLEAWVPFAREVSQIAVRGRDGEVGFYPLSENVHRDGILRLARSRPGDPLAGVARRAVGRILEHLDYVGVLAVEFFVTDEGLVANEMAPRVHNSGHWTLEGAETSQFENHLRAVAGLPLGSTAPVGAAAMVNFIGTLPDPEEVLAVPGAHLHLYGKAPRPGRKLGHATLRGTLEGFEAGLESLLRLAGDRS